MTLGLLRWLRGATVVVAVAYCLALLYWSYPYLKARLSTGGADLEDSNTVEAWPEADALREALRRKFLQYKPEELRRFKHGIELAGEHPLNPLTEAIFVVGARPVLPVSGAEPLKFEHRMVDVGLRGERLIWGTAILALIVLLARDLWRQRSMEEEILASKLAPPAGLDLQGLDLPKLLHAEIQHYERLCDRAYARSTFLLRGAIFIAIGGLGALNFLPETNEAVTGSDDLWFLLTKSYGVVLVVNALALVFLRQYRSSTEDYRYMINLRWRRVNSLAASLDGGKKEQLTKALLAEPFPEERLKRDGGAAPMEPAEDGEMEGGILATLKKAFKPGEEKEKEK